MNWETQAALSRAWKEVGISGWAQAWNIGCELGLINFFLLFVLYYDL